MKIMHFAVVLSALLVSCCRAAPLDSEIREPSAASHVHVSPVSHESVRSDRSDHSAFPKETYIKVAIVPDEQPIRVVHHSKRSPHHGGDHSEDGTSEPQTGHQPAGSPPHETPETSHTRERRDGYGYGGSQSGGIKTAPYTDGSSAGGSYDSSAINAGCGGGSGCGAGFGGGPGHGAARGSGSGRRPGSGRGRGSGGAGFGAGGSGFGTGGAGLGTGGTGYGSGLISSGGTGGYVSPVKGVPAVGGGFGSSGIGHDSSAHGSSGFGLSEPYSKPDSDGYGSEGSPSYSGSHSGGSPLLASGHSTGFGGGPQGTPGFGGSSGFGGGSHGASGFGGGSHGDTGFGSSGSVYEGISGAGKAQGSHGLDGGSFAFQGPDTSGVGLDTSYSGSPSGSGFKKGSSYKAPVRSGY